MQYFGESWGAPINELSPQVPTPVGEPCAWCTLAIQDGDPGVLTDGTPTPYHRDCFMAHAVQGRMLHPLNGPAATPEQRRRQASGLWDLLKQTQAAD